MQDSIIQLLTALTGSLGFALLFHLRVHLLPWAMFGGFLCWGSYLFFGRAFAGDFFPCLLAAACTELYAEVLARMKHAPAILFYIPGVIPLVPGKSLFQTMSAVVQNDWKAASSFGIATGVSALGIAIGMSLVWALVFTTQKTAALRAGKRRIGL